MRAVRLDFIPHTPPRWPGYALLTVASLGAVLVSSQYFHTARSLTDAESAASRLERRVLRQRDTTATASSVMPKDSALAQRAAEVTRRLATPWERLFKALETFRHQNIALLSVEPDAINGTVRITAEAKDTAAMLAYVEDLRESGLLANVTLSAHQVMPENPLKPVRFSFGGQWIEAP
jgi:Tfp pilus assembly protein PilN